MPRQYFNALGKQEKQRQRSRERYRATSTAKETSAVKLSRQARAEAESEAARRWSGPIVFKSSGGVFIVGGRDCEGVFHYGSSRESWGAAFDEAEKPKLSDIVQIK